MAIINLWDLKPFENKKLQFIDIGGGYFGHIPQSIQNYFDFDIPSYNDYADAICKEMKLSFPSENVSLKTHIFDSLIIFLIKIG